MPESILSQLMEKKDLKAYIDIRLKRLSKEIPKLTKIMPKKKRGVAISRTMGRIRELRLLRRLLLENKIKLKASGFGNI